MPDTTYMGVDDRRDHSFRLPGTSDDPDHYGAIIAAGRAGNANAELLRGIANEEFPPIARATMLSLLSPMSTGVCCSTTAPFACVDYFAVPWSSVWDTIMDCTGMFSILTGDSDGTGRNSRVAHAPGIRHRDGGAQRSRRPH